MLELVLQALAFAAALAVAAGIVLAIVLALTMALMSRTDALDPDLLFLLIVPVAWILVGRVAFTFQDLTIPPSFFELLVAAVMFALTGFFVLMTGFAERWTPWKPPTGNLLFFRGFETALALLALTEGFTAAMLLLSQVGAISITPPIAGPQAATARPPDQWGAAESILIWNLLDMLPSVKAPQTLNWTLAYHVTDSLGGSVLLAYKVLVVIPVIGAIRKLLSPGAGQPDEEPAEPTLTPEEEEAILRMKAAGGTGPQPANEDDN
jgi:hypothetical protein